MNKSFYALIIMITLLFAGSRAEAIPINPGFETGVVGYTTTGNVQILNSLGPITPTQGSSFALLSNGPFDVGNDGLVDTSTLQSDLFLFDPNASVLNFDFNFVTEEFTGINALAYDFFEATLITTSGSETLAFMDTTFNGFGLIDGGNPIVAPDGSLFFEHTGFLTASLDVSSYAGTSGYLLFSISDEFDGSFDSGVLIDNINVTVSGGNPVPEPTTFLLFGTGILGAFFARKKKA